MLRGCASAEPAPGSYMEEVVVIAKAPSHAYMEEIVITAERPRADVTPGAINPPALPHEPSAGRPDTERHAVSTGVRESRAYAAPRTRRLL